MRGKTLVAFLGLAFVLTACTDDSPGLIVSHVVAWDANCTHSEGSDTKIATGSYDVFCAESYFVALLVKSFTMSLADEVRPRAEPSIIQFDNAEVHLKNLAGQQIAGLDAFSTPVEGTVLPGTATEPGQGIVLVEAIPAFYSSALNNNQFIDRKIIASFRLYGSTTGGTDVEASEYTFPIQICRGCQTFFRKCPNMTDDQETLYQSLSGCQGGHGYDGSVCVCDIGATGNECESCLELNF